MAFPVTLNGRTYTLADFEGTNYVDGLPDAFEDFVTHAGAIYKTTSTTSNMIGTGSKSFTTADNSLPYQVGTPLRITDSAAPSTNWMDGIVTAYSGTSLTVNVVGYAGSGTKTSWNINIGGGPNTVSGTLPVAQGGTGATTAGAAATNLGLGTGDSPTFSGVNLGDNNKAIFGAGSDLQIYHSGSHSYIDDTGTGNLIIRASSALSLQKYTGEIMAQLTADGAVDLYYDNATKLSTTSTGIDVTGTAVTDGVTVAGNLSVDGGTIKLDGNYPVGTENVALGDAALDDASLTGAFNTAIGTSALTSNAGGNFNSALGRDSLKANTSGNSNVGAGVSALLVNTTGSNNTAVGVNALVSNTTASDSVAVGYQAGYANTTNGGVTYVGRLAGYQATGSFNSFYGYGSGSAITTGSKNTILGRYDGNYGGLDIRTASNHIVLSDGDGNPRVHVDASGRAYIGPENTGSARFNVHSEGGSLWSGTFYQLSNSDITNLNCRHDYARSGQNATQINFQDYQGIDRGSIKTNNSSTSYNTSSDYRLKENVVEITGATDRLKQLKPSRFNFINDPDRTVDGFLAHEVSDIVPEAISGEKDAVDADNNPKYQQIDQSKLVPLLVATIKELEARITALENA